MEDYLNNLELTHVQRRVVDFLISQKGYAREDIEANREFTVEMQDTSFKAKADIALKVDGVTFMIFTCVMNSMESWERHSLAFCRVVESCQIPYAAVTDGETVRMLDVVKGGAVPAALDSIPSKQAALRIIKETSLCPYSEERREKEKRILYAFDAIKCSANSSGSE
ncbi:MAG: type I restriction enzyme HsdR N-terminal domain-containing protein [Nitrospirae bacterium]|nr:type I restriction enzyme HsdR N-terminal domain-containing protein [Nitrospirota bacterium]